MKKNKITVSSILKGLFIALVIFILYLPIIIIFVLSIDSSRTGNTFTGVTFEWYKEIFTNKPLYMSIITSFAVALSATVISAFLGTFAAIGIHALDKKAREKVILLNNIPVLNAEIVTGISVMIICSFLIPIIPDFFGYWTLLIAHVFFTMPYVILSVIPKLNELDPNLYDATTDLGVRPFKALWKIVIPSIDTGIVSGSLLAFTLSIDDFVISYFTSGNGVTNFSNWIYVRLGRRNFTPAAYAFNSLLTIVILLIVLVPQFKKNQKAKKNTRSL